MPPDGYRDEIIDGRLVVSAAPNRKHQRWSGDLFGLLQERESAGLGEAYHAPVDVRLFPNRETPIVQPDLLFLNRHQLDGYRDALVVGPPDLMIEIFSASTRSVDLTRKARLYAEASVPESWVADPGEPSLRGYAVGDGE